MVNNNKKYFREIYPEHWIAKQESQIGNYSHHRYQEISLDQLDCYPGCSLFECGCGSGDLLNRITKKYENMQCFGIDLGRNSLLWAKKNTSAKYPQNLVEGDITSLPIKENAVDRVLSSSVLWYLTEPETAIREMIRILKPGGKFVFDIRSPYHITNWFTQVSLKMRRIKEKKTIQYTFFTPKKIDELLQTLPVAFEIKGYFVLLPTRLPILGTRWGNWSRYSSWLSYQAGHGFGRWFSQKLLVSGYKINN